MIFRKQSISDCYAGIESLFLKQNKIKLLLTLNDFFWWNIHSKPTVALGLSFVNIKGRLILNTWIWLWNDKVDDQSSIFIYLFFFFSKTSYSVKGE